jgi:hypothetical protein
VIPTSPVIIYAEFPLFPQQAHAIFSFLSHTCALAFLAFLAHALACMLAPTLPCTRARSHSRTPTHTHTHTALYTTHNTTQHCTALYCTALHRTAPHCTALRRTLHCTAMHRTAMRSTEHCTATHRKLRCKLQPALNTASHTALRGNYRNFEGGHIGP